MKKLRFYVAAVVLSAVLPASAQRLALGVKGGADIAKMSFKNDVFNADNRTGWFIGPTLKITTFTGLGLDISALYNQRSTKIDLYAETTESLAKQVETLKTRQVIVPLNLRYTIGIGAAANIFAFAGPQIAFRVGDEVQNLTDFKNEAVEWRLKNSNFSVNVGLGITLDYLQLTANYNVGVGKTGEVTWNKTAEAAKEGFKGNYNSWQIGLAYFF